MFKKIIAVTLTLIMCLGVGIMPVYANNEIRVTIDGEVVQFDVPPQIYFGRTMVPMRAIFEQLGAEIELDAERYVIEATFADTFIRMMVNNNTVTVNSNTFTIDVPPRIVDGRTLVPTRFVSESLGMRVDWDEATRTVRISTYLQPDAISTRPQIDNLPVNPSINPDATITIGLVPPKTRAEYLRMYDGTSFAYNGRTYTASDFFDNYNGLSFEVIELTEGEGGGWVVNVRQRGYNPSNITSSSNGTDLEIEYMLSDAYIEAVREEFYRLLNEHRRNHGLREVQVNLELQAFADVRAGELLNRAGGMHERPNNLPLNDDRWYSFGENAASVTILDPDPQITARHTFNRWRNSEGHNRHMLWDFDDRIVIGFGMAPTINVQNNVVSGAIFASGIDLN